jgi:membrane protein YdbS with pleckstrin-like domain
VVVHKGWLSSNTTTIDYDKIVEVSVNEPFTERQAYGSGNIKIKTAGSIVHDVTLAHINAPYEIKKKLDQLRTVPKAS